uniref:Periviscerokinin-1 n=1 Tax=Polyspilota aeruginosa TaxID=444978 RepID=PVK1_POLAI|nr:RecName: Full=Periviscerokinin-1; Short=Polae-PVK-1 [Polyspilota aeruginosa]
QTLIPMPRL